MTSTHQAHVKDIRKTLDTIDNIFRDEEEKGSDDEQAPLSDSDRQILIEAKGLLGRGKELSKAEERVLAQAKQIIDSRS